MLRKLNYRMFDGEGGGSATGTAVGDSGNANAVGSSAENVGNAGNDQPAQAAQTETREQRFAKMIGKDGEFKDLYDAKVRRLVGDRMKTAVAREKAVQPILDTLSQAFGTDDLAVLQNKLQSSKELWEHGANEAGMTVDQYREFQNLKLMQQRYERQKADLERMEGANRQFAQWQEQSVGVREIYPDFDLEAELQNPTFHNLLLAGASVQNSYEVAHLAQIKDSTKKIAAEETQRLITDNIRARGARPSENGATGSNGSLEPAKWSRSERKEAIKRVTKNPGLKISFGSHS